MISEISVRRERVVIAGNGACFLSTGRQKWGNGYKKVLRFLSAESVWREGKVGGFYILRIPIRVWERGKGVGRGNYGKIGEIVERRHVAKGLKSLIR